VKSSIPRYLVLGIGIFLLPIIQAQNEPTNNWGNGFRLTSTTFSDGGTLPLSTVYNQCPYYADGENKSPELSWVNAPRGTRSFVVIMYDITASFTHWGLYNIAPATTGLPENAGVPHSPYGPQVNNDYGVGDLSYDGPCPPSTAMPVVHHYIFTVYALDIVLPTLPTFGDFPPGAEALYHALIAAGRDGHILRTASISGFFPGSS